MFFPSPTLFLHDLRLGGRVFDEVHTFFYARLQRSQAEAPTQLVQTLMPSLTASPAARVAAWIAEDLAEGPGDWQILKAELDKDRLSSRPLFLK